MSNDRVAITSVDIRNYKAFENYSIRLQHMNILVGPNNCGKSTLVGAFRALEAGLRRAGARRPEPVEGPRGTVLGYHLSEESLPISIENVHTDYAETDTTITFRLSNANKLQLYFPRDGGCNLIPEATHPWSRTAEAFRTVFPVSVAVVPVLGPVEHNEELLQPETVQRNLSTHRASRHFRNYWYHFPNGFGEFADYVARTWPGMEIQAPERVSAMSTELVMYCLEHRMTRELFWAGFGFQVWCQLLTHVLRAQQASLFVVDEPDVYLHADVQRQLLILLRAIESDVILATHSTEIISEADPSEIVIVDKRRRSAQRLRDIESVQAVLNEVGSIQNLTLTRLAKNRTVLFLEGEKDFAILRDFARHLGLDELASGVNLTPVESEGFSSWERIKALGWGIERTLGQPLRIGVIYDRDYACPEQVQSILDELRAHVALAHIHERKEIENYLLVPEVLCRAMQSAVSERARRLGEQSAEPGSIVEILERLTGPLKGRVQSQYIARRTEYLRRTGRDAATIAEETLEWFEPIWGCLETRMEVVPGKDVLKLLRDELQSQYAISLTDHRIVGAFKPKEIPADLANLLRALDAFRNHEG